MGRPSTLAIRVTSDSRQAQGDIRGAESNIMGTLGKLKSAGPAAAAAAAVAIGAALVKGFNEALEQGRIVAKLGAQLGLTGPEAAKAGKLAGKLFSEGIATDFQQAADSIAATMRSGLAPPGATTAQLKLISTEATDLANIFGKDLTEGVRAAATMVRTGLAKNSTEAFDILTRGLQLGADQADDLLDTFNEYSTQFRDMGIDGRTALGLIVQGLKGGARDADVAADAFKELNIRVKDQSAAEALKTLGFNAKDMARQFATGGPQAAASLDALLDRLRAVQDPAERTTLAVSLLGTQAEDLSKALFAFDPSTAVAGLGQIDGAAAAAGASLRDNASAEVERFQRVAQQKLVDFMGTNVVPALRDFYTWWQDKIQPTLRQAADVYIQYLAPQLRALKDSMERATQAVRDNRSSWEPLWQIIKNDVMPVMSQLATKNAKYLGDALVALITVLSTLAKWLATGVEWLRKLQNAFDSIKVPSWMKTLTQGALGNVWDLATRSSAPQSSQSLARAAGLELKTAAAAAPRSIRQRAMNFAPRMSLMVTIDGQQLQGRITTTVRGALMADGSRAVAGGWV